MSLYGGGWRAQDSSILRDGALECVMFYLN